MLSGGFTERGMSRLAVLGDNQDSTRYIQTPNDYFLPFATQPVDRTFIFQQENASIHSSNQTKQWFVTQNVNVPTCPASSLDLNPIENLWGILARSVYADLRPYANAKELKEIIFFEWEKLDQTLLYKLVRTMRSRCVEVLEKQGKKTQYSTQWVQP